MLKITSLQDLKKYLETRKEMVEKQQTLLNTTGAVMHRRGILYGFEESIKAVEALLLYEVENPLKGSNF